MLQIRAKSLPLTCLFILNRTAEDNKEAFGDVAKLVKSSFYVDNYLDSVNSEEEAIERCQRLSQLLALGGFRLTKWLSSNCRVLSSVDSKERMIPKIDLNLDDLPTEKTLGVQWDCESDMIVFKIRPINVALSKRDIISEVASLFSSTR